MTDIQEKDVTKEAVASFNEARPDSALFIKQDVTKEEDWKKIVNTIESLLYLSQNTFLFAFLFTEMYFFFFDKKKNREIRKIECCCQQCCYLH